MVMMMGGGWGRRCERCFDSRIDLKPNTGLFSNQHHVKSHEFTWCWFEKRILKVFFFRFSCSNLILYDLSTFNFWYWNLFFFWSDTGLIGATSLDQFASADFFHEEMKTDDKLTLTCSAVTAKGILAPLLVTSHSCSLAQPLQLYLLCRHFLMLCRGLLLGSSAGIPLLVSCFQSMFCCSCFIHPPSPDPRG